MAMQEALLVVPGFKVRGWNLRGRCRAPARSYAFLRRVLIHLTVYDFVCGLKKRLEVFERKRIAI